MTRKLWACTIEHEIYVLSEDKPTDWEVTGYIRDSYDEPYVSVRPVTSNVLCWEKDELVFGPDEDVTAEQALKESLETALKEGAKPKS